MKKLIILLTVFAFAFTANVFSQSVATSDNESLVVSADVVATGLTIAEEIPLNFGTVSIETVTTQAPNQAGAGVLQINGEDNQDVYITVPSSSIDLTIAGGTDTIVLNNFQFAIGSSDDATSSTPYTLNNSTALSATGSAYFFVGGTLTTLGFGVNAPGSYSGTLTVEASYNSF